jgi:ferredoxin
MRRPVPTGDGFSGTYAAAVALVEVQFEPLGRIVLVAPGTTLLAASQAAGVDLAFGCTRGMCGTDAGRVVPGHGVEPAGHTERSTLERMGLDTEFWLSCSARVRDGAGPVRVDLDRF